MQGSPNFRDMIGEPGSKSNVLRGTLDGEGKIWLHICLQNKY